MGVLRLALVTERTIVPTGKGGKKNLMMRLKELEKHVELAAKVGKLEVVLGENALGRLKVVSPS